MSVQLLPGIGELDPNSLCYSIYSQLYNNFFNAQDKKSPENPYGIEEGDGTSIRLRNTAYGFADAIAGAVDGGGGDGGVLIDYLKKSGGNMSGPLTANYGFEGGIGNTRLIETYYEEEQYGTRFYDDVRIGGESLYIGDRQLLRYSSVTGRATIDAEVIDFADATLRSSGEMLFGADKATGVYISTAAIQIQGFDVWHRGNANRTDVDWTMNNSTVVGKLNVSGEATLLSKLSALYGFDLGFNGVPLLVGAKETLSANAFLSFGSGYGVKIGGVPVLIRVADGDIQLSSAGADLLLGSESTNKIRLFAGLSDIDGDNILLTKYGAAYFPDSLRVRHNYGDELLSSYRVDSDDEGIIIHKRLRFGTANGAMFYGDRQGVTFSSLSEHVKVNNNLYQVCRTLFSHRPSTSYYKPLDRESDSFFISTDTDFITFGKPIEALGHIGIDGSPTRLTANALYFGSDKYLLSVEGGIKHYGNAIFLDTLSSEYFSSGFAGAGWAILRNRTTGNISATFDELTIRKKMRIYELEVQKAYATNGSFWVSDNCSGDIVEKL